MDFCEDPVVYSNKLVLKYLNPTTKQHASINCNSRIAQDQNESDIEVEWSRVPLSFGKFKCARILETESTQCEAYEIRFGDNTAVKYDISCDNAWQRPLSKIEIQLKSSVNGILRGLCGNLEPECPNFINDTTVCVDDVTTLLDYWK